MRRRASARLALNFSAEPAGLDILSAREALRITPPVDDLAVEIDRRRLKISGKFLSDRVYEIAIAPGALLDARKRPLAPPFNKRFAFTSDTPALQWDAGYGIVERFGPQLLPLRGRGYDRADIRIHAIDPLSRDFWPFPAMASRPKTPRSRRCRAMSPNIGATAPTSRPTRSRSASRRWDRPPFRDSSTCRSSAAAPTPNSASISRRISPASPAREQPGAYLVGLRADRSARKRRWLRVQVTDLTLSAIEEPERVRFAVTSLSTAQPVGGAQMRIEGVKDDKFVTLAKGATDASGFFIWASASAPRPNPPHRRRQGAGHARGRAGQRAVRICQGKLVEARGRLARLDDRSRAAARAEARARSAISSPSGRSTGPRSPCISRAMCAAIVAAR